jgi:hypothetical protein
MTLTVREDSLVNGLDPDDLVLSTALAYPNPFNNKLSIKLESPRSELLNITFTDALSKVLSRGSVRTLPGEEMIYTIDLKGTNLPEGLYIIHIVNQEGTFREILKVVKR